MILARVVGTVVASNKEPKMEGMKLLLLEKIDPVSLKGKNDFVVSVDCIGAGTGEVVFTLQAAAQGLQNKPRVCHPTHR